MQRISRWLCAWTAFSAVLCGSVLFSEASASAATNGNNKANAAPARAKKTLLFTPVATHTVVDGQTLGKIAKRFGVSIEAICVANDIQRDARLSLGQRLLIPSKDWDVNEALRLIQAQSDAERAKVMGWRAYARTPKKPGQVELVATGRRWRGAVTAKGGKLSKEAPQAFRRALYSWRTGTETDINPRLIALLTRASDTFGGRPLRIASGYREHSHAKDSKHKQGEACDFAVEGVPNDALRDYLLTHENVGVGFYPNSSFVHLDVRDLKTTWVDTSGPGDVPNYVLTRKLGSGSRHTHVAPRQVSRQPGRS